MTTNEARLTKLIFFLHLGGFFPTLYSPSFLKEQSAWCSRTFLLGPLKVQPAPAYWQATSVPSHRYL